MFSAPASRSVTQTMIADILGDWREGDDRKTTQVTQRPFGFPAIFAQLPGQSFCLTP